MGSHTGGEAPSCRDNFFLSRFMTARSFAGFVSLSVRIIIDRVAEVRVDSGMTLQHWTLLTGV